jgi:hypothetical protein
LPVSQFAPWFRFQSPLVKPDVRSYRIRLSPVPSCLRSWQVGAARRDVKEPKLFVQVFLRESLEASVVAARTPPQPVSQTAIYVSSDEVIRVHDWPLIEVSAPPT